MTVLQKRGKEEQWEYKILRVIIGIIVVDFLAHKYCWLTAGGEQH
jgi:hypothetical protein